MNFWLKIMEDLHILRKLINNMHSFDEYLNILVRVQGEDTEGRFGARIKNNKIKKNACKFQKYMVKYFV